MLGDASQKLSRSRSGLYTFSLFLGRASANPTVNSCIYRDNREGCRLLTAKYILCTGSDILVISQEASTAERMSCGHQECSSSMPFRPSAPEVSREHSKCRTQ
jgi:hypothetical protein